MSRVFLLGWDAADWKIIQPLVDKGKMPHLQKLIEGGVSGNMRTLQPPLSPMLWNSVATGKTGEKHGVLGFVESRPDRQGVQVVSSHTRRCPALWNILSERGHGTHVVNWYASYPAEKINGISVSNLFCQPPASNVAEWSVPSDAVAPDDYLTDLAPLRIEPKDIPAECIRLIVPEAHQLAPERDQRLTMIAERLAQLYTTHAVGTWLAERNDWSFLAVYFEAIDHFSHDLMEYRAPQREGVSDRDFALFSEAIDNVYILHDQLLGRYLELIDDDTIVLLLSDHGFHNDHLRPEGSSSMEADPVSWHRDNGVFVAHGPGLKSDSLAFGLSLLDIAPTVLTLLGEAVPEDMDGTVMTQIWESPPEVKLCAPFPQNDQMPAAALLLDQSDAATAARNQLVALGYLANVPTDSEDSMLQADFSNLSVLATIHQSKGQFKEALETLDQLILLTENFSDFTQRKQAFRQILSQRVHCLIKLEEFEQASQLVQAEWSVDETDSMEKCLWIEIYFSQGDLRGALSKIESLLEETPSDLYLQLQAARCYSQLQSWKESSVFAEQVIEANPESEEAWFFLGLANLNQGHYEDAVTQLMQSVSLRHLFPQAHLALAHCAAHIGNAPWAIRAASIAAAQAPDLGEAQKLLQQLHEKTEGQYHDQEWSRPGAEYPILEKSNLSMNKLHQLMSEARQAMHVQDYEKSRGIVSQVLSLVPDHLDAMLIDGICLVQQREWQQAEKALNQVLEAGPRLIPMYHLGLIYLQTSREKLAQDCFLKCIDVSPEHALSHLHLGLSYTETEEGNLAEKCFRQALILAPSLSEAREALDRLSHRQRFKKSPIMNRHPHVFYNESFSVPNTITIVSGLPRSGTSLMMQILQASGLELLTDGLRKADRSNEKGYFELESVKDPRLIHEWTSTACGKVVKVIHAILPYLPQQYHYRVIFMRRKFSDILASQTAMLEEGSHSLEEQENQLITEYKKQVESSIAWLKEQKNIDLIEVDYSHLIEYSESVFNELEEFLSRKLDQEIVRKVIDPSLAHWNSKL